MDVKLQMSKAIDGKKCQRVGKAVRTGRSFQDGSAEQHSLRPVPVGALFMGMRGCGSETISE
jgi:hypothetical protein